MVLAVAFIPLVVTTEMSGEKAELLVTMWHHAVTHSRGHNCEMSHQKRMTEAYRHYSRLLSHNITNQQ